MTKPAEPEGLLAAFASGIDSADIPAVTREHAKTLVIDGIACAFASDLSQETEQVAAVAASLGEGSSTVVGRDTPFSTAGATLLNGYQITSMSICDVYRTARCHMTPLVVPGALAVAERSHATGRQLLDAVAVGIEVAARVAAGLNHAAFRARGWHVPGVVGPFGAAAAAGRLMVFDASRMRHALGLAGTQSAGSYASLGTPAIKFHQARAALSGLLAAEMAGQGFAAGPNPLTAADGGMFNTHSDGGNPERLVAGLGTIWELDDIAIRLWPGSSPLQAMFTGLFDIIEQTNVRPEEVGRIEIGIAPKTLAAEPRIDRPAGVFEALLSYSFLCTVALHDRELWFDQVQPARFTDPALLDYAAEHVALTGVEGLGAQACRLTVTTFDGQEHVRAVDEARGAPSNPATRDDIVRKFHRCADRRVGPDKATRLLADLDNLDGIDDVAELCVALRG